MKRLNITLALAAVLLGGGTAFATAEKYQAETVYLDIDNVWKPIPPGQAVFCQNDPSRLCTGTGNAENPQPSAKRGTAALADMQVAK